MKKITLVSIVLFWALLAPAFCQELDAEATVKRFYECVQQGDEEMLLGSVLTSELASEIRKIDPKNVDAFEGVGGTVGEIVVSLRMIKQKLMTMSFENLRLMVKKKTSTSAIIEASFDGDSVMLGEKLSGKGLDELTLKKVQNDWRVEKVVDKMREK